MHWLSPGMRCGRPHLPFVFFPSYTLRHRSWVVHGKSGSGPDLRFPKNYLVWGKLKIDSQPYNPSPNLHPKSDLVKSVLQQNYTFRNNTTGGPTQAGKLAGQGKKSHAGRGGIVEFMSKSNLNAKQFFQVFLPTNHNTFDAM